MGTHRPPVVMPDMKRRRASTGERIATIMVHICCRSVCFHTEYLCIGFLIACRNV